MNQQANIESVRTRRAALLDGIEFLRCADIETARLDAEVLLCHAVAASKTELFLSLEQTLSQSEECLFQSLLARRARREPVAYITGVKEFWSLELAVDANVLIPRPETELLVEWTLARARNGGRGGSLAVLDLGTGSGAIAVALATELTDARIWAVDISAAALAVALSNARRHGVERRMHFVAGDLFEPFLGQELQFDLMVANPPYIASQALTDLAPEIRDYEPAVALDGGPDGIAYYRRIVAGAAHWLVDGGSLLFEIGADQGQAVKELFVQSGAFDRPAIYQDLAGKDRVVAAMKGGAGG